MDHERLDQRLRTAAWGTFLILIGGLGFVPGDQTQWAILGSGIILLGLNLTRRVSKIQVSGFSLALGAVAFLLGGMVLARSALGFHIKIELFPLMLIALGVYLLLPGSRQAAAS
jgi:hypothetical protein